MPEFIAKKMTTIGKKSRAVIIPYNIIMGYNLDPSKPIKIVITQQNEQTGLISPNLYLQGAQQGVYV